MSGRLLLRSAFSCLLATIATHQGLAQVSSVAQNTEAPAPRPKLVADRIEGQPQLNSSERSVTMFGGFVRNASHPFQRLQQTGYNSHGSSNLDALLITPAQLIDNRASEFRARSTCSDKITTDEVPFDQTDRSRILGRGISQTESASPRQQILPAGLQYPSLNANPSTLTKLSPLGWSPTPPANVPLNEFRMMAEVFGQMLSEPNSQHRLAGGSTLQTRPAPNFPQQHQMVSSPMPPMPMIVSEGSRRELRCVEWQLANPQPIRDSIQVETGTILGCWKREVGQWRCEIHITPQHITLSLHEQDRTVHGKLMNCSLRVFAEYQFSRNGVTAIGLITGVDLQVKGDAMNTFTNFGLLPDAFEEQPFAMNLRLQGEQLIVNQVRLPHMSDNQCGALLMRLLSGQYSKANHSNKDSNHLKTLPNQSGNRLAPNQAGATSQSSMNLRPIQPK